MPQMPPSCRTFQTGAFHRRNVGLLLWGWQREEAPRELVYTGRKTGQRWVSEPHARQSLLEKGESQCPPNPTQTPDKGLREPPNN